MYFNNLLKLIIFFFICLISTTQREIDTAVCKENAYSDFCGSHEDIIRNYFEKRMAWTTSNLGSILFKNIPYENFSQNSTKNKTFVVLIWTYFNWLKIRHIENYRKNRASPLEHCSVKNCIFTGDNSQMSDADAVVIHIQKGKLPDMQNRSKDQTYVILADESPINLFSLTFGKHPTFKDLANIFNWSMTFRVEADVPVPYGRTVPLKKPLMPTKQFETAALADIIPYWTSKKLDGLVYVLMSNCVPYRIQFLKDLQKHMRIDVFGACASNDTYKDFCPQRFSSQACDFVNKYLFYFVIENSRCHQYFSEKVFAHAYEKGAIPIILGPPLQDCEKLLPPKSFIHVNHFNNLEELSKYIKDVSVNEEALREYHKWRNHFKVVNENGYFGANSFHFCRVCEALNYNDRKEKTYSEDDLKKLFDKQLNCIPSYYQVYKGFNMNTNITYL